MCIRDSVYTALQAGILDGAENNELALTANGHGDICKYYSYDMHPVSYTHLDVYKRQIYWRMLKPPEQFLSAQAAFFIYFSFFCCTCSWASCLSLIHI